MVIHTWNPFYILEEEQPWDPDLDSWHHCHPTQWFYFSQYGIITGYYKFWELERKLGNNHGVLHIE
jgi:hypothetical protein